MYHKCPTQYAPSNMKMRGHFCKGQGNNYVLVQWGRCKMSWDRHFLFSSKHGADTFSSSSPVGLTFFLDAAILFGTI